MDISVGCWPNRAGDDDQHGVLLKHCRDDSGRSRCVPVPDTFVVHCLRRHRQDRDMHYCEDIVGAKLSLHSVLLHQLGSLLELRLRCVLVRTGNIHIIPFFVYVHQQ
eukprot:PhF_6_TR38573/c1_g1_i1/m.57255